jgi:hypothetical protein
MENNLRVIKTARSEAAINAAVEEGYWPLIEPVTPSPEIKSKYAILQDKTTGKIQVIHDYRARGYNIFPNSEAQLQTVIPFTYYYPHQFESPYAAYLIPSDMSIGETVMLVDLIEDVIRSSSNQGDTYRLQSCEAIWDGKDFTIIYDNAHKGSTFIG